MKKLFVGAALVAAVAAPLAAQSSVVTGQPSVFSVTPYVGYMAYGDHFETPAGAEFTNDNAAIYGVQVGIDMSPNFVARRQLRLLEDELGVRVLRAR